MQNVQSELSRTYESRKEEIKKRIKEFHNLPEEEWLYEFIFCLLTPQSKGKKCWEAVQELKKSNFQNIENTLRKKTRFHITKAKHIQEALHKWPQVKAKIKATSDVLVLRDYLYENIKGLGMKEASHFLRNIGKSSNRLAILDRHILKNLVSHKIIKGVRSLDQRTYLSIEEKMKLFSKEIGVPLDHLDLLFWAEETGEVFK